MDLNHNFHNYYPLPSNTLFNVSKVLNSEEESFASFAHFIVEAKYYTNALCFLSYSHTHRISNNYVTYNFAKHVSGLSLWMKDSSTPQ